jgi:hypothetical protein
MCYVVVMTPTQRTPDEYVIFNAIDADRECQMGEVMMMPPTRKARMREWRLRCRQEMRHRQKEPTCWWPKDIGC